MHVGEELDKTAVPNPNNERGIHLGDWPKKSIL